MKPVEISLRAVLTKMLPPDSQTTLSILSELVRFKTLPETPNIEIVNWIKTYLEDHGISSQILVGPEGDRSNLFATIGPADKPGYIVSGHVDVVSVEGQDWATDPFKLTDVGNGHYAARGTTDMKGFLTSVLAMVPYFKSLDLSSPIHMAFSYDEEVGCRGVPHLIKKLPDLCAPPKGCIVGEPSDLIPVLSHKGKCAVKIAFRGKAAHSSDPDKGVNAIYPAAKLVKLAKELAEELKHSWPKDTRFQPPYSTLSTGMIAGGTAVNIIPDHCAVRFEARTVPGQSPRDITDLIIARAQEIVAQSTDGLDCTYKILSEYPALSPCEDSNFTSLMEDISGQAAQQSVSYGTEAGLFSRVGIPSIICGPGSISRAHRPNEYITDKELMKCNQMLAKLTADHCVRH